MNKYIDADKFYASQVARCCVQPLIGTCTSDNALLYDELQKMPAADVVSVVRCKDCKYLMFSDMYGECSQGHMGIVKPDDFCSYGERKDGE